MKRDIHVYDIEFSFQSTSLLFFMFILLLLKNEDKAMVHIFFLKSVIRTECGQKSWV